MGRRAASEERRCDERETAGADDLTVRLLSSWADITVTARLVYDRECPVVSILVTQHSVLVVSHYCMQATTRTLLVRQLPEAYIRAIAAVDVSLEAVEVEQLDRVVVM